MNASSDREAALLRVREVIERLVRDGSATANLEARSMSCSLLPWAVMRGGRCATW